MGAKSVHISGDPYNLQRFLDAQAGTIDDAVAELKLGQKKTCWMWFVFPQLQGLGYSQMSRKYAITSLQEARAYLDHPVLGPRLMDCTRLVLLAQNLSIQEIFGDPDWMKFRSSMTLFARAASGENVFQEALERYFDGVSDNATLERLGD